MGVKQYKPTSPARRGLILVDRSSLWKGKPVKGLTEGKTKSGGRNNNGHVTSRGNPTFIDNIFMTVSPVITPTC